MEPEKRSTQKTSRHRKDIALHLVNYENYVNNQSTQREAADALGVPRSTLRHWKDRKESIPIAASVIECLESPDGTDFLHRLITALQFVMTEVGGCGIRLVSLVLELSHLNYFVGSSYEPLRRRTVELENQIIAFGHEERKRRSESMQKKKISVAEDETFHPKACLVAIDPASNFILLEKYSEKRDAASWNEAMDEALSGLNVEVIQSTSDEARGIVSHVEKHLGAHHSPDIFHVQYEISKGCSAAFASKTRQSEKVLEKADEDLKKLKQFEASPSSGKGRKPDILSKSVDELETLKIASENHVKECRENEETVSQSKKAIGVDYHPYDLKTGKPNSAASLEEALHAHFDIIEKTAKENRLKENAIKHIEKAKRVIPSLVQTLIFYWSMINVLLQSLSLTKPLERIMKEILIPAEYLFLASKKGKDAEQRKAIYDTATELINQLSITSEWCQLSDDEQSRLQKAAQEGASYFQRSSSCVEGRNGYLSLRHHGLHQLSNRKLEALTVIHNYFIKRPDGSTAADRFFGGNGRDLFEHLLEKMPYPGRSGESANLLKKAA